MKRTELRENIFKLLFVSMFTEKEEMPEQLKLYFENMERLAENDQTYMEEKVGNVLAKETEIDEILNGISKGWKTTRMSRVDLTILRLAVYEILFDADVPTGVAINEAVELGKQFGGDDSAAFHRRVRHYALDDASVQKGAGGAGSGAGSDPGKPDRRARHPRF